MGQFESRLITLLFIFLAISSSWGLYLMHHQQTQLPKNYGHYPDSIAIDLTLTNLDPSGFLTEIIHAKKALHYPDTKTTNFMNITMQIFNHDNTIPSWFIFAPTGVLEGKGEIIKAQGPVHMQQESYPKHFATFIETSDVTILTDKKYLITVAPIHLSQSGLQIDAVGANYDYNQQVLNLVNQVNINYQPKLRENL